MADLQVFTASLRSSADSCHGAGGTNERAATKGVA
jgi:hypothetical protein